MTKGSYWPAWTGPAICLGVALGVGRMANCAAYFTPAYCGPLLLIAAVAIIFAALHFTTGRRSEEGV